MTPPTSKSLAPLTDRSLGEQAYVAIRTSIVTGRFALGERIVEQRVASELGISRAPVREALRRLVEERLVTERPRYGTFVREITAQDFVDIYNARISIETTAIRLSTQRGPDLEDAQRAIDVMADAAGRGDTAGVIDLELEVHQAICDAAGNPFLSAAFRTLSGPVRLALGVDSDHYDDLVAITAEHPPLLEAIRAGDEREAARTMHEHIVASIGPVLHRLDDAPHGVLEPFEPGAA